MPERQAIDMVPDNVTDLDLQNQLVDSVHDEELVVVSPRPSEPSTAEELLMCNHKLSDLYNRQRQIELARNDGTVIIEQSQRLIKIPTSMMLSDILTLVGPLAFWLGHRLVTRDQFALFKRVWQLLRLMAEKIAKPLRFKLDLSTVLLPMLERAAKVCEEGAVPLEAHQFLRYIVT